MPNEIDLDALERAAKAATPGKRESHGIAIGVHGDRRRPFLRMWDGDGPKGMFVSLPNVELVPQHVDADFIAACDPQTILALIALAREAETLRGRELEGQRG